jgi:hypothetical protein
VKIREGIPKLYQTLDNTIKKILKSEGLDLFQIRIRHEDVSGHQGNAPFKLECIFPNVTVRQLHVSPHRFIREIAYGMGVSGDELLIVKYIRNANPGKLMAPELVSRIPLNDDPDFTAVIQDFKSWIVNAMDELRALILPSQKVAPLS